jgi:hypothetical protein
MHRVSNLKYLYKTRIFNFLEAVLFTPVYGQNSLFWLIFSMFLAKIAALRRGMAATDYLSGLTHSRASASVASEVAFVRKITKRKSPDRKADRKKRRRLSC